MKDQDVRAVAGIQQGDLLLVGRKLNPVHLGLRGAGHDMLPVRRRPRVTVLLGYANVVERIPGPRSGARLR
ncbi:hypothetical protein QJS66_11000 [Kocuria rhizophila]|nr:hypothetical protein QJS66_11000 [Kocuria rhizophila]